MESYSRRTSITPSSSKVRWCGVVAELHWLGNLAFLRRPPASTDSKTSLLSMVDSGIFSHQQWIKTNAFSGTNCSQTLTWWVGRNKIFFSSFSTRSQKYELLAFWQQQQSSETPRDWSRWEQWNGVEWQTLHMLARWLDQVTSRRTWLHSMNGVSREKITRKLARIMPLSITVQQQWLKGREFYPKGNFRFFGVTSWPSNLVIAWDLKKYLRQFVPLGTGQIKQITFNSGFTYVLCYQRRQLVTKTGLSQGPL